MANLFFAAEFEGINLIRLLGHLHRVLLSLPLKLFTKYLF